jgi:YesN/AraC family two-component response regulator
MKNLEGSLMGLVLRSRCKHKGIINEIIHYLDNNFSEINCRKGLSDKFGIDDAYLCRLFKENSKASIIKYINAKRIELASELLKEHGSMVINIAYHVGFNNLSYFYRIFKKHTGMTPLEYARRNTIQKMVG